MRVEMALRIIATARSHGRICVSVSGGKDSTVLLDLIRHVDADSPAVWFDSGAELQSTQDFLATLPNLLVIHPAHTVIDLWKMHGFGGHPATNKDGAPKLHRTLIAEPAERALKITGCTVSALGLRMDESAGRKMSGKVHGPLHQTGTNWRLCPLLDWTERDIWEYIHSREIGYNAAYDVMESIGLPAKAQRVSTNLDGNALQYGRFVYLKKMEPEAFNRLAADFPKLRSYA